MLTASFALAMAIAQVASGRIAPTRDALAPLFAEANRNPAGIVPLILAGSAAIDALEPERARLLADTLEPFCRRAFFGPERLPGMERLGLRLHAVKRGEVPERIASRLRVDAGLFASLNRGYDERRLREGAELKVLDLSDRSLSIVVRRGLWRLSAWRVLPDGGRALVMSVPVGLGAPESPTPAGSSFVALRAREPEWTDPATRQVFAHGDPRNVLGGYWIALDPEGLGRTGIGLHGFTGDAPANWIEQPASRGCVRLLQPDIERVFRIAIQGTRVSIE